MKGTSLNTNHFQITNNGLYINRDTTRGNPGLLLIYANWCGHCQRFKPIFEELCSTLGNNFPCKSIEHDDLNNELKEALDFKGYPTIKFFDQSGKIVSEYQGDRSKEDLLKEICKLYHHCIKYH